ncbi:GNAT family N-acetyltransferase [Paractinoplanes toevensis]|uniref:GNAT family N-acetyltransferase n=1 Tax=Paractinoplanes toevensis TaxID=571911 RepID=UPI001BB2F566|nr:GNAT family N-acetyltransferase [Actinoplanes toevensis]
MPLEQPVIEVEDLILRPWRKNDAANVVKAFGDPEIRAWHELELNSREDAVRWIDGWHDRWAAETGAAWAITKAAEEGQLLGQVAFRSLFLDAGMAECSYWVMPDYRGNGVAGKATQAMGDWALNELGLYRLEIVHSVRNLRSCRVATKAGFTAEGIKHSLQRYKTGGFHDMHLHARVRPAETRARPLDRALLDIIAHPRLVSTVTLMSLGSALLAWASSPIMVFLPFLAFAGTLAVRPLLGRTVRRQPLEAGSQPISARR